MMQGFSCSEITGPNGKKYYVGVGSIFESKARAKRYRVRTVYITGHAIPNTVHDFVHWKGGPLRHGPVVIDDESPDKSVVATPEEAHAFFESL